MIFYNILAIETIDSYKCDSDAFVMLEAKVTQAHLNYILLNKNRRYCVSELRNMISD